jgi:hypothetical protein
MRSLLLPLAFLPLVLTVLPAATDTSKLLKPINLGLNTSADEDEPHVAASGLRLVYLSTAEGKTSLLASKRITTAQPWKPGKPQDDLEGITQKGAVCSLFLSEVKNKSHFVYYACKNPKAKKPNYDVYVAVNPLPGPGKVFGSSQPLTTVDTEVDEMHPWLTADGKSLYFSRKTDAGWCQFVTRRDDATGALGFKDPEQVGLPPGFHHATLTKDGKTMILQGPLPKDRWGLFRSTYVARDKTWSKPEPLDTLNHPDAPTGDRSPCLNSDGTMLYFASDRPGGQGGVDLYVIPMSQLPKK